MKSAFTFIRDGLFGLRILRKKPAFLAAVLLTLGLSTGASTAIFSVVNTLLLRPLPYEGSERLMMVWQTNVERLKQYGSEYLPVSYGDFTELKESSQSFEQIAALDTWFANLTDVDDPERLYGVRASDNFFSLMRVRPLLGRTFTAEDGLPDAERVVVLSHNFWQRRFAGDPGVVGRKISLNSAPFIVIGILPQDFRFTEASNLSSFKFSTRTDVWAPLKLGEQANNRGFHNLAVVGRLKADVSVGQAQAEVQTYASRAAQQYPDTNKSYGMKAITLAEQVTGDLRPVLLIIFMATGFVLLIACVNMAILLLARMTTRYREIAVRLALGASKGRIIRQLLAESLFLSLLGGALGIIIAYWGTHLLISFSPYRVLQNTPVTIDLRVLGFTLAVSVLTGLLFGVLPALQSVKSNLSEDLKEGAYGSSRRSQHLQQFLVVAEIALTVVLLVGAGLATKSFIYLLNVDPGFKPERVLTMDVFLPFSRYNDATKTVPFFQQALGKLKAIPEVESVGMNYALPFSGTNPSNTFEIEGRPPLQTGEIQSANLGLINEDYFRALGIPLHRGRYFNDYDKDGAQPVAIIDEGMAKQFFPNEDPLGKRISVASKKLLTIVGVVGSIKHDAFEKKPRPYVYLPFQQRGYTYTTFAIRTKTEDPTGVIAAVRQEFKTLDKDLPISNVTTLEKTYSEAIAPQRYSMLLLLIFALIALLLTEIGIYGVMNYAAQQRKREVGIRIALGASPHDVFRLFIKRGMILTVAGVAIGVLSSFWLVQLMSSLIYGINSRDLITFSLISVITGLATFLACYLPAKSATRIDPAEVLRAD
jgi:putative ABC transport system permease protein